jgi:hypothetical protein
MGESQVNGDAAELLLLQAVRVSAGERLYQSALAVIDVTCRAYDDVSHDSFDSTGNSRERTVRAEPGQFNHSCTEAARP